ncbi:hypothetical protein PR048_002774 [Dryococelus australis]|uniref:Uncharacterized protein n=1 Tax=Dryococelus australis TaxID=614101 RepID=A0ABQ9INF1_9NEOP|nr:hypothetical protein PR048_002774 [Dryococelus australis]
MSRFSVELIKWGHSGQVAVAIPRGALVAQWIERFQLGPQLGRRGYCNIYDAIDFFWSYTTEVIIGFVKPSVLLGLLRKKSRKNENGRPRRLGPTDCLDALPPINKRGETQQCCRHSDGKFHQSASRRRNKGLTLVSLGGGGSVEAGGRLKNSEIEEAKGRTSKVENVMPGGRWGKEMGRREVWWNPSQQVSVPCYLARHVSSAGGAPLGGRSFQRGVRARLPAKPTLPLAAVRINVPAVDLPQRSKRVAEYLKYDLLLKLPNVPPMCSPTKRMHIPDDNINDRGWVYKQYRPYAHAIGSARRCFVVIVELRELKREVWSGAEMQGRGKREIPEKTCGPAAWSGTTNHSKKGTKDILDFDCLESGGRLSCDDGWRKWERVSRASDGLPCLSLLGVLSPPKTCVAACPRTFSQHTLSTRPKKAEDIVPTDTFVLVAHPKNRRILISSLADSLLDATLGSLPSPQEYQHTGWGILLETARAPQRIHRKTPTLALPLPRHRYLNASYTILAHYLLLKRPLFDSSAVSIVNILRVRLSTLTNISLGAGLADLVLLIGRQGLRTYRYLTVARTTQLDGAPPHCARVATEYPYQLFPGRWIGRPLPSYWPPRSPYLTDYCVQGWLQTEVYASKPATRELIARIVDAVARLKQEHVALRQATRTLKRRACAGGKSHCCKLIATQTILLKWLQVIGNTPLVIAVEVETPFSQGPVCGVEHVEAMACVLTLQMDHTAVLNSWKQWYVVLTLHIDHAVVLNIQD